MTAASRPKILRASFGSSLSAWDSRSLRSNEVSRRVALAIGAEAQRAGLAEETASDELERRVDATMWTPRYMRLTASAD